MTTFNKFSNFGFKLIAGLILFLSFFTLAFSVKVAAVDSTCKAEIVSIKWWDLGNPGKFWPIIPDSCSQGENGLKPLSFAVLPTMAIRLYGFLVSLAFTLIFPVILYAGIWYMWGGIDNSGTDQARKLLLNSLYGWLFLALFYILVFTALSVLGNVNGLDLQNTDLSTFFV